MEKLRLLVVDDEQPMREGVIRALRKYTVSLPYAEEDYGFELSEAGTGEEAIELIDQAPPDLLLLDYKLPGIKGLDVLDHITQHQLDILTVMITAYASLETAVSATRYGAYDFLAKPFTPEELRSAVHKATKHLVLSRLARRLSEEKRRVRFQFISVLAHELKSPLAAVEGYLRIIQAKSAGETLAAYDTMVNRSITRLEGMRKMILDILDLTRIESGQKQRELTEVDLREVAQAAIETALPSAQEHGVTIELHAPERAPVTADRGELDIIFNNLVSNAVKYNRPDGRVDLTIETDEERATITCRDTGIGLSETEAKQLFREFVRIKNARTKNILGSGLGLSTVKKLATEYYGGDVRVDSAPGAGSTFTVTLRRHQPAPATTPESR
ncbi:MAG: ATP-binding protein [candidate division WOR-3 bacterium]|nr:ATP-binding protein [candidate division WOR-3 bacterium]